MISWLWGLIKFVLEILLLAAFLYSFITHFMVWLEKRYKQLQNEPDSDIPWRYLLKNLCLETVYQFLCLLLIPFSKLLKQSKIKNLPSNPKTPPILLIHGHFHNRNDWLWFRRHLECIDGMGPIFTINLTPTNTIRASAQEVEKKINKIKKATGENRIILIGHSRGALVASDYTEHLAAENVASVICLGAPFSGTNVAVFGVTENVKEMAPNAPLVTQLKEDIQQSEVPYYFIASKVDNLIVPWHSACPWQLRTPRNTLILDDLGHLGLLLSPRVVTQVVEWIFDDIEK